MANVHGLRKPSCQVGGHLNHAPQVAAIANKAKGPLVQIRRGGRQNGILARSCSRLRKTTYIRNSHQEDDQRLGRQQQLSAPGAIH